ncbi:MAG: DUF58 domain-containing protein [Acidimicrobiales bacterium]
MKRQSTIRLPVAVMITVIGALSAILWGRPDAALLAIPWAVLLVVGLSGSKSQPVSGTITSDSNRVVSGEAISVSAKLTGASGWLLAICRPTSGFSTSRSDGAVEPDDEDPQVKSDSEPDSAPESESDSDQRGDVTAVAAVAKPGRSTEVTFTLNTSAWGNHDVGRIDLEVTEPFGLLRWSGSLHVSNEVRVHPRPIDLQRLLAPWHVRRLSGAHRSRSVGQGIEYADIRQFAAGDSLRDINWRASARSDELWVSQRHPERSTDVVLLLDTFVESGHDIDAVLGLAIEAAIGLAESHLSVSDRVGLIEIGGIMRWVTPGAGRHQLQRLVDALLATTLYENASDRHILSIPPRALPPRSFVVALSPLLDPRFVEGLSVLRAAGHDVSVIDCPPTLDSFEGDSWSESARVAYRLWSIERTITRDQLAERGIAVGRWQPGDHIDPVLAELAAQRNGMRPAVGTGTGS